MTTTYSGIEIYRMSQTPTWKNSITNADSLAYSKDLYKLYPTTAFGILSGRIYIAIKANVEITGQWLINIIWILNLPRIMIFNKNLYH